MTYGQTGYEAYAKQTGGKTFDGRDMPTWLELPERIRAAWDAAGQAIADEIEQRGPRVQGDWSGWPTDGHVRVRP